jgi:hypothetical protein
MIDNLFVGGTVGVSSLKRVWRVFRNKSKLVGLPDTAPPLLYVVCIAHKIQLTLKTVFELDEVKQGACVLAFARLLCVHD